MNKLHDKIRGALYGVAVGDSLGGPVEFMSAEEIQSKYGKFTEMTGGGWLDLAPGEGTDDTAMTLAVAEGIVKNPKDPVPAIGKLFIKWLETEPRYIGPTCANAISHAKRSKAKTTADWLNCSLQVDRQRRGMTAGNGALMRTVYVGLYYDNAYDRAVKARNIAKMTHWSEESAQICHEYVELINDALEEGAIYCEWPEKMAKPTGYVRDSYECALYAINCSADFEDAVINAVNLGGDADTIGAIAGGLAGALHGYSQIPERWIKALDEDVKKRLDYLAEVAYKHRKENEK